MVQILTVYGPAFLVALSVLVFFHELGHYLVARWNGVRVEVFSIGFGRELFGWTDSHGTRWKFSIMPLGGYVKMFGDVNAASAGAAEVESMTPAEKDVCFHTKRVGQRAAIVFAGPLANYILAVVILALLYIFIGQQSTPAVVNEVLPGSAAATAGIRPGDKVVMVDGCAIERFEELRQVVSLRPDQTMQMDVLRDGHIVHLTVTPRRHQLPGQVRQLARDRPARRRRPRRRDGALRAGDRGMARHPRDQERGRARPSPRSARCSRARARPTTSAGRCASPRCRVR